MYLFLDTETTGLAPSAVPTKGNFHSWPRMLALGWQVVSAEGEVLDQHRLVVTDIHIVEGSSKFPLRGPVLDAGERVCLIHAIDRVVTAIGKAFVVVGHNLRFDLGVIQSEQFRLGRFVTFPPPRVRLQCTIDLAAKSRAVTKLYGLSGRIPLDRLYTALFQKQLSAHHDPLVDADACRQIYFALQNLK